MAKDFIGYQSLLDAASRGVVREAMRKIEKTGLIGAHHFFLTFKTHFPGLEIPDFLREQYPEEMTIILQHQYSGLKVKEHHFEVTLTFRKLPVTLVIPYDALTAFVDPGVQFGLQFRGAEGDAKPGTPTKLPPPAATEQNVEKGAPAPDKPAEKSAAPGEVVSLDAFRKK